MFVHKPKTKQFCEELRMLTWHPMEKSGISKAFSWLLPLSLLFSESYLCLCKAVTKRTVNDCDHD